MKFVLYYTENATSPQLADEFHGIALHHRQFSAKAAALCTVDGLGVRRPYLVCRDERSATPDSSKRRLRTVAFVAFTTA